MALGLIAIGAFCFIMGMKSRPKNLKKPPVRLRFKKNLPHDLETPLAVLHSTKSELIGTLIWAALTVVSVLLLLRGMGNPLFLAPCGIGVVYTLWISTRQVLLYPNAVLLKTLFHKKVFWLDEVDSIVSYNILNSFNRGVSYGYKILQNEAVVLTLPKGSFKSVDRIEEVYRGSRYLEEIWEGQLPET